jgi:hypothetical protein
LTRIGSIEAAARIAKAAELLADVTLEKTHHSVRAALANDKAARDSADAAHASAIAANAALSVNGDATHEERKADKVAFESRKDPTGHAAVSVKRNPARTWIERTHDVVDVATAKKTP